MKEHPILFSGDMVRAILEGRKTMMRRVIKPQPRPLGDDGRRTTYSWRDGLYALQFYPDRSDILKHCPYGQPGDRLWVRETCLLWYSTSQGKRTLGGDDAPIFAEDPEWNELVADGKALRKARGVRCGWEIVPSIHMSRWASRILLEVTAVRVERLQDITDDDAKAEGTIQFRVDDLNAWKPGYLKARFSALWDSINAKRGYGWDTNPWVWVVEFKRIKE